MFLLIFLLLFLVSGHVNSVDDCSFGLLSLQKDDNTTTATATLHCQCNGTMSDCPNHGVVVEGLAIFWTGDGIKFLNSTERTVGITWKTTDTFQIDTQLRETVIFMCVTEGMFLRTHFQDDKTYYMKVNTSLLTDLAATLLPHFSPTKPHFF